MVWGDTTTTTWKENTIREKQERTGKWKGGENPVSFSDASLLQKTNQLLNAWKVLGALSAIWKRLRKLRLKGRDLPVSAKKEEKAFQRRKGFLFS